jgi:hypothetical protein
VIPVGFLGSRIETVFQGTSRYQEQLARYRVVADIPSNHKKVVVPYRAKLQNWNCPLRLPFGFCSWRKRKKTTAPIPDEIKRTWNEQERTSRQVPNRNERAMLLVIRGVEQDPGLAVEVENVIQLWFT